MFHEECHLCHFICLRDNHSFRNAPQEVRERDKHMDAQFHMQSLLKSPVTQNETSGALVACARPGFPMSRRCTRECSVFLMLSNFDHTENPLKAREHVRVKHGALHPKAFETVQRQRMHSRQVCKPYSNSARDLHTGHGAAS